MGWRNSFYSLNMLNYTYKILIYTCNIVVKQLLTLVKWQFTLVKIYLFPKDSRIGERRAGGTCARWRGREGWRCRERKPLWFFYVCLSVLKLKFDVWKDFLCFFYVWLSVLNLEFDVQKDFLCFFYVWLSVLNLEFDVWKDFLCFFYVWLSVLSSSKTHCDSSTFVRLF